MTFPTRAAQLRAALESILPGIHVAPSMQHPRDAAKTGVIRPAQMTIIPASPTSHRLVYIDSNLSGDQTRTEQFHAVLEALHSQLDRRRWRITDERHAPRIGAMDVWEATIEEHPRLATAPGYRLFRRMHSIASWTSLEWSQGRASLPAPDEGSIPSEPTPAARLGPAGLRFVGDIASADGSVGLEWPLDAAASGMTEALRLTEPCAELIAVEEQEAHDTTVWRRIDFSVAGLRHSAAHGVPRSILRLRADFHPGDADSIRTWLTTNQSESSLVLTTPRHEVLESTILEWTLHATWSAAEVELALLVTPLADLTPVLEVSP